MVSFWWVLAAFIGGGCAGVLVMALMCFAGGLPEQTSLITRSACNEHNIEREWQIVDRRRAG